MIGVAPPAYDPAAPTTASTLPVGAPATVRAYVAELLRRHRRAFLLLVTVNTVAVLASMVGPYLLGGLVERVSDGARELHLGLTATLFLLALVVQAAFVRQVRLRGAMLGERMLADLREDFLVRSVGLPPGVLERAGTGDLLSRITTDIDRLANAMREAVPQLAIGAVWVALLLGGLVVTAPPLAPAVLLAVPLLVAGCRWYFRRAPSAYRSEAAGYAAVAAVLAETVDAGRTVEAHRLGDRRIRLSDRRIKEWTAWERYTLWLRSVLFPVINVTHVTVLASVTLIGGVFVLQGWIGVGQLTTAALIAQMMVDPVGLILRWYDELQVAQVSLARLVGVRDIEPDAGDSGAAPRAGTCTRTGCASATSTAWTCCARCPSRSPPAPGWRWSARRAPESPPWAGCSRASTRPGTAGSRWAARSCRGCPPNGSARTSPWSTRSTTSSWVPCATTSGSPARTPTTRSCGPRWPRSTPMPGPAAWTTAWTPRSAPGASRSPRPGPADRAGPAGAGRPAHAGARRGDVAARPAGGAAPGAVPGPGAGRPHGRRHRPPSAHRP